MDDSELNKLGITRKWNPSAGQYDLHVSHSVQTEQEKQPWVDAFRPALPRETLGILDVGCGPGAMGLSLVEMGYEVVGINLSEGMMDVGRKKYDERALSMFVQKGDVDNLPFTDDCFDAVLCTLTQPHTAIVSWKRVGRDGGRVIVIEGVWDDTKTTTKIRREVSISLGKVFYPLAVPAPYAAEVLADLLNSGGVSEDAIRRYFVEGGFADVTLENFMHICVLRRKQLNRYRTISHHWCYYLVPGTREA